MMGGIRHHNVVDMELSRWLCSGRSTLLLSAGIGMRALSTHGKSL